MKVRRKEGCKEEEGRGRKEGMRLEGGGMEEVREEGRKEGRNGGRTDRRKEGRRKKIGRGRKDIEGWKEGY